MGLFKKEKDYFFSSFYELALFSKDAIDKLSDFLLNFDKTKLYEKKEEIHAIEHNADIKKHEIEERLAKEFITPIDREDIFLLLDKIDDLTDSIDEISYKLYLRNYEELPSNISIFINKSKEAVYALLEILKNMDKISSKKTMDPLLNKVIEVEEEVDREYEINVKNLYDSIKDDNKPLSLWKDEKVYSYFEYVTDKCRDVVKEVQIIMYKNL